MVNFVLGFVAAWLTYGALMLTAEVLGAFRFALARPDKEPTE